MQDFRLDIPDCPRAAVRRLERELGVSGALAQVLVRRDLREPTSASAFLAAAEAHPASAFAGMGDAVASVLRHVRARARITVHGDYDVDGVCSTAVLVRALRRLDADVDSYLPDRASEGYGLTEETVRRLAARGTRLIVTADCAITAVGETELAQGLGLDVVITDHHSPRADGALPRAPIVHPQLCGYPCADLCATAVAYKLAAALTHAGGGDGQELAQDLDLVALATIADVVRLTGENRTLVRQGLGALARTRKPGLRALMGIARVDPARVDERSVAFALAPRLNAAGRMHRADAALELVLTEDRARAELIAQELDRANSERRKVEREIRFAAERELRAQRERGAHAYVLAGEGWHAGVIGIVAARLAEGHHRPVVLIALDGDHGRGSGRSVEGYDLLAGLSACDEHLTRYGGHRAAAGLEVERGRVAGLAAALSEHAAEALGAQEPVAVERVDAIVEGRELGMGLAEELQALAPFGRGNPGVSLLVADAVFRDGRPMGEGRHVRFVVESHGVRARAVAFGGGSRLPVEDGAPAQATFTLEVNEWNGVSEPRLVLRRARPVPAPGALAQLPRAATAPLSPEPELVLFASP